MQHERVPLTASEFRALVDAVADGSETLPRPTSSSSQKLNTDHFALLLTRFARRIEEQCFCELLSRYAAPGGHGSTVLLRCADRKASGRETSVSSRTDTYLSYNALARLIEPCDSKNIILQSPAMPLTSEEMERINMIDEEKGFLALLIASRLDQSGTGKIHGPALLLRSLHSWFKRSDLIWRHIIQKSSIGRLTPTHAAEVLLGGRQVTTSETELRLGLQQHLVDERSTFPSPSPISITNATSYLEDIIADLRLCDARNRVAIGEMDKRAAAMAQKRLHERLLDAEQKKQKKELNQSWFMISEIEKVFDTANDKPDDLMRKEIAEQETLRQRRSKQWPPPVQLFSVRVRDLHSYLSFRNRLLLDNIFDRLLYGIEQFDEAAGHHLRDVLEDLAEDNARGEERKNIHTKRRSFDPKSVDGEQNRLKNGHIRTKNKHMSDVVKKASVRYLSILHGNIADIIRRYQIPIASDEIVTLLAHFDPENSGAVPIDRICREAKVSS